MSIDLMGVDSVGIQYAENTKRVWVCVDGACVLRINNMKEYEYTEIDAQSDLDTGLPNYDPVVTAVALSLYAYNVSAEERARKLYDHFDGKCAELEYLIRILNAHATYAATELAYPTAVVYVTHALEVYGQEALHRCQVNTGG